MPHWLFINGMQPTIPENAPIDRPIGKRARAQHGKAAGQDAAQAKRLTIQGPGACHLVHGNIQVA